MNHISLFGIAASIPCIVILTSCSQVGPTDSDFQTALQNQLPPYWEIISLEVKERENTGTEVQPNIVTRFHAVAQLKEDTFFKEDIINDIDASRQQGVTFISKSEVKGKKIDIYGVSNSKLIAEKWQSDFRFDINTAGELGYPISSFDGRTIVKDSKEQEEFVAQVKKKIEEEEAALKKAIISRQIFSGERLETKDKRRRFKLSFTSFDESSGTFSGELIYPDESNNRVGELIYPDGDIVFVVEGALSVSNLSFKTTRILKDNASNDRSRGGLRGLGDFIVRPNNSAFSFHLVSAYKLSGKRDYQNRIHSQSDEVLLIWE